MLLSVVLCIGHSGIGVFQIDLVQSMLPAHLHNCMYYQMEKYSEMLSLSSAALLYEPDSGDILFWHIRAMYKLGSLDLTQKYLAQHAEKLSEEQKTVCVLS